MHRFWDTVIYPFLLEIQPKNIVEVGSEFGLNTKRILEYCKDYGANLTSIDSLPQFDVSSFKEEFGDKFEMIEDISLHILPYLKDFDLIFIDGDHNWYTVYNELKVIEGNFNQNSFPFIILHDVAWPYARRDLYYNPENIPEEFRQEYEKGGMYPDKNDLLDVGGFNPHLFNAINENTLKNGVLTAIEDFLDETSLDLYFYSINIFHGLGFIFPKDKIDINILNNIILSSDIESIAEISYIKTKIDNLLTIRTKNNQINSLNNNLKSKDEKIASLNGSLKTKENEIINLTKDNYSTNQKIGLLTEEKNTLSSFNEKLNQINDNLINWNTSLELSNEKLNEEINTLIAKNESLLSFNDKLNYINDDLLSKNDSLVNDIKNLNHTTSQLKNENKTLNSQKNNLKNNNDKLTNEIKGLKKINHELNNNRDSLLKSYELLDIEHKSDKTSLNELYKRFPNLPESVIENIEKEGLFNEDFYLNQYHDVKNADVDSFNHFIEYGYKEGRLISNRASDNYRFNILIADYFNGQENVINDLKNENEHYKKNLDEVFSSRSWKITSPLRKFFSKLR